MNYKVSYTIGREIILINAADMYELEDKIKWIKREINLLPIDIQVIDDEEKLL